MNRGLVSNIIFNVDGGKIYRGREFKQKNSFMGSKDKCGFGPLKRRHLWALMWRCPVESSNMEQAVSKTSLPICLDYVFFFSSGLSVLKSGKPRESWDELATLQTIDTDLGIVSKQMLNRYKDHLHVTLVMI